VQNLVKIGRSAAELLRIFDFQNGGRRPPSWIWYDVTTDQPRLLFDGPNIVLKLHADRFFILCKKQQNKDISIFIYSARLASIYNCLFKLYDPLGSFGGLLPPMNSDIVVTPKRAVLG